MSPVSHMRRRAHSLASISEGAGKDSSLGFSFFSVNLVLQQHVFLHQHLHRSVCWGGCLASAAPLGLCSVLGICLRDLGVEFSADLNLSVQVTVLMHTILGLSLCLLCFTFLNSP